MNCLIIPYRTNALRPQSALSNAAAQHSCKVSMPLFYSPPLWQPLLQATRYFHYTKLLFFLVNQTQRLYTLLHQKKLISKKSPQYRQKHEAKTTPAAIKIVVKNGGLPYLTSTITLPPNKIVTKVIYRAGWNDAVCHAARHVEK